MIIVHRTNSALPPSSFLEMAIWNERNKRFERDWQLTGGLLFEEWPMGNNPMTIWHQDMQGFNRRVSDHFDVISEWHFHKSSISRNGRSMQRRIWTILSSALIDWMCLSVKCLSWLSHALMTYRCSTFIDLALVLKSRLISTLNVFVFWSCPETFQSM
jgi:hypothetical protein